MNGHVPIPSEEWGMKPGSGMWCKRCGFLLVGRDGVKTFRASKPCSPVRIELRGGNS